MAKMHTNTPPSDARIAASAREAAALVLAHPISLRLNAISVDILCDLAHRDLRVPVTRDEAAWLRQAVLILMEIERLHDGEVAA